MKTGNRGGFIKVVILIVIVLIVLGYYGFNLKDALDSGTIKENLATFWGWIVTGWNWLVNLIKGLLGQN